MADTQRCVPVGMFNFQCLKKKVYGEWHRSAVFVQSWQDKCLNDVPTHPPSLSQKMPITPLQKKEVGY